MKKKLSAYFLVLSVVLASAAQLLFRYAMLGHGNAASGFVASVFDFGSGQLLALSAGILLYAISMISWILALIRFEVTVAYPVMSVSYIIVYASAAGMPLYNESISAGGLLGTVMIVIGVSMVPLSEGAGRRDENPM